MVRTSVAHCLRGCEETGAPACDNRLMKRTTFPTVLVGLLALAGCGSDSSTSDGADTTLTEAVTTTVAPPTTVDVPGAPTAPDDAAALVVELLNGAPIDEASFEASFALVFRDAIGFDDFSTLVTQVAAEGPWTLEPAGEVVGASGRYAIVSQAGETILLDVSVDPDGEGINGLFLSPERVFESPETVDDAVARLEALGRVRAVVADASNGACAPAVDAGANEVMPLGSAFKLYVLGAVVKAMDDGSIGWDTTVAIRDDLDSLPSGTTQNDEPGTELTIRELADRMISISDNTATDHLIDLVGREAVEEMLTPMGNDAIERNRPFLTTRDLFILKFADRALGERYAVADEAERRSILENEVAALDLPELSEFDPSQPVLVEELEWFASPVAMCDAMVWLSADPTALEILSSNPGVPATSSDWETIAFKGGSEPGLIAMVWWTSTTDGRAFVTAGSVVSSSGPVDESEAANLLAFLRDRGPGLDEVGESG